MTKWLYLSPEAINPKNKGTFCSSTFKVEGKKVPFFFRFVASWLRYGHFLIFLVCLQVEGIINMTKWLYLSSVATNKTRLCLGQKRLICFFVQMLTRPQLYKGGDEQMKPNRRTICCKNKAPTVK